MSFEKAISYLPESFVQILDFIASTLINFCSSSSATNKELLNSLTEMITKFAVKFLTYIVA